MSTLVEGGKATREPTKTRLQRFVRCSIKPPFALQPRDVEILRIVAGHRVITSADLQILSGRSPQTTLRRLQRLYHHGFLDRPRSQRETNNTALVYALGEQGAKVIAQEAGRALIGNYREKNRQLKTQHLLHGLMISRFQVALRHAAESSGRVVVEHWFGDGFIRDAVRVQTRDGMERIPVAPDAVFVLRLLETGEAIHVFLEADRSTMEMRRFVTKLRGYFHFWRSGRQEKILGAKHCLVVTSTTSPERAHNLAEAAKSVNPRGLRMFLFSCERNYLPTDSQTILSSIWRTPADSRAHSLLE